MVMNGSDIVLRVNGLEKFYNDIRVLKGITINVKRGEKLSSAAHPVQENRHSFDALMDLKLIRVDISACRTVSRALH